MGLFLLVAAFAAWLVSREPADATDRRSVPAPPSRTETALQALDARVGQLAGRLDTLAEEVAGWEAQRRDQASVLAALEEKISAPQDASAVVTDRLREIGQAADARFVRLEADVAKLGQTQRARLVTLASELKDVRKQLASKHPASETADQVPDAVPFRLVSVDRWGEIPSAVVSLDDHTRFLSVGDVLAGWRVTAMDAGAGRLGLERDGHTLTLEVLR